MTVAFQEWGHVVVITPDHAVYEGGDCDAMEVRLLALVEKGARIVVDLSLVDSLTAHCIGVLVNAQRVAEQNGGRIVLCGAKPLERSLLAKMGLAGVLPHYDDPAGAVQALTRTLSSVA